MIAGINKIWYQYYGSMISKGYSIGNNRIGLLFSTDWQLLNFTRGTAQFTSENSGIVYKHSVKYSNITPDAIDLDFAKKLHKKLLVLALELNNGVTVIVGVENPLRVNFKYNTGLDAFDNRGYIVEMESLSKCPLEFYILSNVPYFYQIKYGFLYNWYVATDVRNIANTGWHVPSSDEFNILSNYLGGVSVAGGKLKETGFVYWDEPNTGATNEVGFNGRGSSGRYDDGRFGSVGVFSGSLKEVCGFWSSTERKLGGIYNYAYPWILQYNTTTFSNWESSYVSKKYGLSIRLVRDTLPDEQGLPDGSETGNYTGNDGKVYKTVKIGSQVWLADNLAETKYRDGSWIHGFDNGVYTPIDDTTWQGLTTGALCAYNNDLANV